MSNSKDVIQMISVKHTSPMLPDPPSTHSKQKRNKGMTKKEWAIVGVFVLGIFFGMVISCLIFGY